MGIAAQTLTNKTANSGWIRTLCGSSFATTSNSACNGGMVNQRSNQLPRPPVSVLFGDMVVSATIPSVPGLPTFTFHGILDYRPLNFEETTYGNTMYQPLGTRGLAMARSFDKMIEQLGIVVSCGLQRTRTSCQPTPAPRTRTRIFFHWETKLKISLWPWSRFYWLVPTTIPNSSQLHHWHKTSTAIPSTPPTQSHHTLPSPYQNPTPNPPSPLHLTNTSSPTPTTSNPLLPAPNASHAVGLVKNPDALSPQTPHVLPPELTTSIRPRC